MGTIFQFFFVNKLGCRGDKPRFYFRAYARKKDIKNGQGISLTVLYRKRDANVPLVRYGTFTLIVYHKFWICKVLEQKKKTADNLPAT